MINFHIFYKDLLIGLLIKSPKLILLCFDLLTRPKKMLFQGDAPEGSDTFQWQLGEEIAWAEIG